MVNADEVDIRQHDEYTQISIIFRRGDNDTQYGYQQMFKKGTKFDILNHFIRIACDHIDSD